MCALFVLSNYETLAVNIVARAKKFDLVNFSFHKMHYATKDIDIKIISQKKVKIFCHLKKSTGRYTYAFKISFCVSENEFQSFRKLMASEIYISKRKYRTHNTGMQVFNKMLNIFTICAETTNFKCVDRDNASINLWLK